MPPKGKGKKASGRKMPPPLPLGEVLTDGVRKREWVIGTSIGKGGFGEIYLAALRGKDVKNAEHVIKIEPLENGPLFSELSYYRRAAKEDAINNWIAARPSLQYLAIPKYITSGNHEFNDTKYRFMVMQRFGTDVERHFRASSKFCEDTVSYLALRLLEALEFLHESEYVHADIKGSNILTGLGREQSRVYLVDYGLAYRFNPDGEHKEYKEDPRKAHDGTLEFTSTDAHNGVCPSRRGDLEILGYCLLQWACGRLPWEDKLGNSNAVAASKKGYKGNAPKLVKDCFGSGSGSKALQGYMSEVYKLGYSAKPPYEKLHKFFKDQLSGRNPVKTLEWLTPAKPVKHALDDEGPSVPVVKRRKKSPVALPLPKRMITAHQPSSSDASEEVDSGGARPKNAKRKVIAQQPSLSDVSEEIDSGAKPSRLKRPKLLLHKEIPDAVYPPELGYKNGKEKIKVPAAPGRGRVVGGRKAAASPPESKAGDKTQVAKKGKMAAARKAEDPPLRRSGRTRNKVNYKDLDSSLDSHKASTSYRESSNEGVDDVGQSTAARKRKRRKS